MSSRFFRALWNATALHSFKAYYSFSNVNVLLKMNIHTSYGSDVILPFYYRSSVSSWNYICVLQ